MQLLEPATVAKTDTEYAQMFEAIQLHTIASHTEIMNSSLLNQLSQT
jgi:hypothetical protein